MPISRCWSKLLAIFAAVIAATACDVTRPEVNAPEVNAPEVNAPEVNAPEVNAPEAELDQRWFGGYLDVTLFPPHRLQDSPAHGTVTTVLSFIGSNPAKPCEPSWGGYYDLEQANDALDLDAQGDRFREAGNDITISFGGQLGTELAVACTDSDALVRAYAAVITKYGLDVVDFDLEGAGLADRAAAKRRAAAIARLQGERPPAAPLKVWLTLPVSPAGLTPDGEASVETMLDAGVELAGINIMTMNFSPLASGQTMLQAAISAAEGTHRRLAELYERTGSPLDAATLWKKIGLTPMIGTNDVQGQIFTLKDAEGLNSFALERGIGRISMWSLNRDTGCHSSNQGQLGNGVSNNCSGVTQERGRFAQLLGNGYTG